MYHSYFIIHCAIKKFIWDVQLTHLPVIVRLKAHKHDLLYFQFLKYLLLMVPRSRTHNKINSALAQHMIKQATHILRIHILNAGLEIDFNIHLRWVNLKYGHL